jgi:hypothetical protein
VNRAAPRLSPVEAAAIARKHRQTIYYALEDGTLHGTQRVKRGRWLIKEACLDAWIDGVPCEHQKALAGVINLDDRRPALSG